MSVLEVVTLVTALGCATVGGVFFAFSTFVMHGLARVEPAAGLAGMQGINLSAVRPPFMLVLFGTALGCLFLAVRGVTTWGEEAASWLLVTSAALYLLGNIVVTGMRNVPLNNAIAVLDPSHPDSADTWRRYVGSWTAWNHVRTVTAIAAATLLMTAWVMTAWR